MGLSTANSITKIVNAPPMAMENKVQRAFELLTDKYDAKVGKNRGEGGESRLTVILTVYGQRMTFDSEKDDYRNFIVRRVKDEMGVGFSSANIEDLNKQLGTIATAMRAPTSGATTCGCACAVDETLDDE